MDTENLFLRSYRVDHLPVVRALMDRLHIPQVIDQFCPIPTLARVSDADCVIVLLLNILSGRLALHRIEHWLSQLDTHLLLGMPQSADAFNDTRLGLALDHLDAIGTDRILGAVVEHYLADPERQRTYTVHQDTTSFVLYGDYDSDLAEGLPRPARGFSKDKRPDLKQLVFGMTLHGGVGMPLVAHMADGNTSDHAANRDQLDVLSQLLPEEDEVTVVADCKLVDAVTVGRLLGAGFHLVSLVPETFNLRAELIRAAWAQHPDDAEWPVLAERRGRRKADPPTRYRGLSFSRPFRVLLDNGDPSTEPVESFEPLRFVVVRSDALAARFDKSLPSKLKKEREALAKFEKKAAKHGYACAADAHNAATRATKGLKYHQVTITTASEERVLKRGRRGRPSKGEAAPTQTVWTVALAITADAPRLAALRQRQSCFVLITDHEVADRSDAEVLSSYRHQSLVEGHSGFRWLKGPAAASPMFLKNPGRIRAMGLVLVLALMVRNYFQFTLRAEMARREVLLEHPFTRKKEAKLTTEMAVAHFDGVSVGRLSGLTGSNRPPSGEVQIQPLLRPTALKILELLSLSEEIYHKPPKWRVTPRAGK
jgi:transposase